MVRVIVPAPRFAAHHCLRYRDGAPYAAARRPRRALVTVVADGSPADDAGVHAGDIVREINRRVGRNAMDARRALADIEAGTPVFLLVWRQGNELFLQIRPN